MKALGIGFVVVEVGAKEGERESRPRDRKNE